ncbi:MAG: transglycosylase SLT domain-containing protein, partial [Kiritimatiellaeota bacterium]|nr:transglycosylase SLT domain-containing protein [Kiritimatiellota bacterium]
MMWRWLVLCLGLGLTGAAGAGLTVTNGEEVYEIDTDLIRELAVATIGDQVDLPSAEEWQQFWTAIVDALQADSLDDLAALSPLAQTAVSYLQALPSAQPVQAWLRQRQDYFDMSRQAQLMYPAPAPARPAAPPSVRGPGPRARLIPPRPPAMSVPVQLTLKRLVYLRSQESWTRKLRGRMKPDEAAFLIPALKNIFEAEGVAPEWVWLAEVESGLNVRARSPVGAAGLFQFMPDTAQR